MTTATDRESILDALERVLARWHETDSFAHAVAETVARTGYARADVERQLRAVALRCRGATMRRVLEEELGAGGTREPDLTGAPRSVLVLASGRVPGLAIEGMAAALAVGATALVRPSRDETVLHHLLGGLRVWEPGLMSKVEVVAAGGLEPPWSRADAAIVFGSDETIALVCSRLSPAAAGRVAAYGSRQGVAVVAPGADVDPSWATRLAGDVLRMRQRGCMSPSWLFTLGSEDEGRALAETVGRALALRREQHVEPGIDARVQQRRSTDADVLGAIAAGMAPESHALHAGDARLTVVHVGDEESLMAQVRGLGSLQQTAVIATGREDRARIADRLLRETGITRICIPGQAHQPDPLWPQDGIGRVLPLLGRSVR